MSRYVIVVHGIGEQRSNETVLAVVNRFAEARAHDPSGAQIWPPGNVLSLGMASGQSGPWLEFEHIPVSWPPATQAPFMGERPPESRLGENLRFVDLHWADLMQKSFKSVGESPEQWTANVIGRLQRKGGLGVRQAPPYWAVETLRLLRDTVVLLRKILLVRDLKEFDDLIFNKFLGDVQLYAEYLKVRGQAVRRFHEVIARIEETDPGARYTIVAHSLGTVMSLDALLYAHADLALRAGLTTTSVPNLPFPGFLEAAGSNASGAEGWIRRLAGGKPSGYPLGALAGATPGERVAHALAGPPSKDSTGMGLSPEEASRLAFLDTSWRERVDAFVTLGSPIDKYLVIWWLNYKYLGSTDWLAEVDHKIQHYNYSDEQDPVGHKLDVAASAPAFARVFETKEDRVFNRYAVPGLAHTQYWKDLPLFRWILDRTVDSQPSPPDSDPRVPEQRVPEPEWFNEAIYKKVLAYSYKVVPLAVVGLDFAAFTWAWYSNSWHSCAIATFLFVAICLIGRHLIDLCVWWRRILISKDSAMRVDAPGFGRADYRATRRRLGHAFRRRLLASQVTFLILSGAASGLYFAIRSGPVGWKRPVFMLAVTVATLVVWIRMFRTADVAWTHSDGECYPVEHPRGENLAATAIRVYGPVILAILAGLIGVRYLARLSSRVAGWIDRLPGLTDHAVDIAFVIASLLVVAAIVYTYLRLRFTLVQRAHAAQPTEPVCFCCYVGLSCERHSERAPAASAQVA